uniref:Uncharacterized protein n=1 Tax=Fagus sylvatica TaxID=28930 RepID=A0A2N9JAE5_FAGSY
MAQPPRLTSSLLSPHLKASRPQRPHALNLLTSRPHASRLTSSSPHLTASRPQPHGLALTSRPHLPLSLSIPFRCCPSLPRSHRCLKARSHTARSGEISPRFWPDLRRFCCGTTFNFASSVQFVFADFLFCFLLR